LTASADAEQVQVSARAAISGGYGVEIAADGSGRAEYVSTPSIALWSSYVASIHLRLDGAVLLDELVLFGVSNQSDNDRWHVFLYPDGADVWVGLRARDGSILRDVAGAFLNPMLNYHGLIVYWDELNDSVGMEVDGVNAGWSNVAMSGVTRNLSIGAMTPTTALQPNGGWISIDDVQAEQLAPYTLPLLVPFQVDEVAAGAFADHIVWRSNIDGYLCKGSELQHVALSPGLHTITASIDPLGITDSVTVEVLP
jgi:hypothetical protein